MVVVVATESPAGPGILHTFVWEPTQTTMAVSAHPLQDPAPLDPPSLTKGGAQEEPQEEAQEEPQEEAQRAPGTHQGSTGGRWEA